MSEQFQSDDSVIIEPVCRECGAKQSPESVACWLCGTQFVEEKEDFFKKIEESSARRDRSQRASRSPAPSEGWSFSLSSLLIVVTLVAVCFALIGSVPGLGVFGSILVFPVLLRTALVIRKRHRLGVPTSRTQQIVFFLTSFVVAHVIATVVLVAAFGTFCIACLATVGTTGRESSLNPFLVAGVVTVPLIALMAIWVRHRYKRDVYKEP